VCENRGPANYNVSGDVSEEGGSDSGATHIEMLEISAKESEQCTKVPLFERYPHIK
jgi:hypothetical protein